jgi:hypothetical protein
MYTRDSSKSIDGQPQTRHAQQEQQQHNATREKKVLVAKTYTRCNT